MYHIIVNGKQQDTGYLDLPVIRIVGEPGHDFEDVAFTIRGSKDGATELRVEVGKLVVGYLNGDTFNPSYDENVELMDETLATAGTSSKHIRIDGPHFRVWWIKSRDSSAYWTLRIQRRVSV